MTAVIEIHNTYSKLVGASIIAIKAVDSKLAVPTPGHQFTMLYKTGRWDGLTRFFKASSGKFPSGLLSQVTQVLQRIGEDYSFEDKRGTLVTPVEDSIDLIDDNRGSITLRDYQYESVKKGLEQTRGIINVATNGGKTEIAAGIIKQLLPTLAAGKKIAFFTHAKEIFHQSHKRLEERLGMKVGKIGDGEWDEQTVTVVMIPTVGKYLTVPKVLPKSAKRTRILNKISSSPKDPGVKQLREEIKQIEKEEWNNIKVKNALVTSYINDVVAFLADEVHHASSDTWYELFMKMENSYYRFGLTGTVDETDPINLNRLLGCTGKIITKISNDFLIESGFSAKPTIYLMPVDCPEVNGDYMEAHAEGIIRCQERNLNFVRKVEERAKLGNQCLIILNETEHGEIVQDLMGAFGVDCVFTHGQKTTKFRQKALEDFKSGETQVLIATTILDEGVDVSGINCLFLMGGGKSMRQVLQRIGRGLRKKSDGSGVEVYDALDYHNEYLTEHTLERYKTYKAEGFEIVKLD